MRTVEIDEEVLDSMFEHIEYLHSLVNSVLALLNAKQPDEWLTTKEAAKILRISVTTLNNLRACLKTIVNRSEFSERNNNSCDHEHFVG